MLKPCAATEDFGRRAEISNANSGRRWRPSGGPLSFRSHIDGLRLVARLGKAAKLPFAVHPHMLRHACGFKLANDGHDTRALQHYFGHNKNIQHTVRYTELSPDRFRDFWR